MSTVAPSAVVNLVSIVAPTAAPNPLINNPAIVTGSKYIAVKNPTLLWGASGPQFTDVQQGGAGDCWLLAAEAATAAHNPAIIENLFHYIGTWNLPAGPVAFYNVTLHESNGLTGTVVVNTELPTGPYSGGFEYDQPVNGVLWAALLEKGYAEANGYGFVTTQNPKVDSYAALGSGYPSWALTAFTGDQSTNYAINSNTIAKDLATGNYIICIWTTTPSNPEIVAGHAYAVVGYYSGPSSLRRSTTAAMPFEVYNPWGANANYSHVYETYIDNGTFINQQYADMSICLL